jgi:hypothetical protein
MLRRTALILLTGLGLSCAPPAGDRADTAAMERRPFDTTATERRPFDTAATERRPFVCV